jgi:signal transduction histidine kinase
MRDPADGESLFRKHPRTGLYRRLRTPGAFYASLLARARWTLLGVLAVVYVLAVLLLERVIMPTYVYRPLRVFLNADCATREGDRTRELIPPDQITDDEIGQIMRSRNQTVTELHKRELDLAQALAQIEHQDRLASLGLLSASVAHELNTPISVLRGSIEKLIEKFYDRPTQDRLMRMLRVTDRLRTISDSLVDFARVRQREVGEIALRPVIDEAWSLVAIDEKASSATFRNLVDEQARVVGNTDRLGQVFVNLLRNALHAIGPNGIISVHAEPNDSGTLSVRVDDDGPGIAADVLPNIFEAFVSSRLDARGTGLGLTVAAGIVEQHGGTIRAENRPDGGARLEVTLPAVRPSSRTFTAVTENQANVH